MNRAARVPPFVAATMLLAGSALLVVHKIVSRAPIYPTWFEPTVNGIAFGTLAALILRRRPAHPMGWVFGSVALLSGVQVTTGEYATFSRAVHPLPGAAAVAVPGELLTSFVLPLVLLMLLLYPEGRPLTRRWGWLVRFVGACAAVALLSALLRPGRYDDLPGYANPLGVPALRDATQGIDGWVTRAEFGVLVVAAVGLVLRYRQSSTVVRQQLKWFGLAVSVFVASAAIVVPLSGRLPQWAPHVAFGLGLVGFAVAIGFAILRHRLYDIDRIVSRTASYAVITGLLVVVYVGLVTAVTRFTPTGNSLAVAGSTLAVAALFQPLRRRVQAAVDRRFNRARYDAGRTVESFSARLREEVDLDSLRAELMGVVYRTVQPSHAGLWLRRPEEVSR